MRARRGPGLAAGGMNGMIRGLGDQVALEAGRAASIGAASVVATASPPLAFAFFAMGACTCLTIAGLIWLAGVYGWVIALAGPGSRSQALALAAARFERDMEIAMMAASAFRDAADVGRVLRGPGPGAGRRGRRRRL